MHWTPRREAFRAIMEGDACIHPASVFDPMSARIAEEIGFEAVMFAGSVASMAVLGAPDLIVLTLSEFADQAYRINRAGNLPLLVDADHGYGNALNVQRTVQELETAGVAALTIEDTDLPQPYGTVGSTRLLSIEEGVGKMKAALSGRQDPSLTIVGRTGASGLTGIDDAIARGRAYQAAGVDAMFFTGGLSEAADIERLGDAMDIPIVIGGSGGGILGDRPFLAKNGVRVSLQGHHPFSASVQATYDTLKALRDGTPPGEITGKASGDTMKRLTRDADYRAWMKEFLGG
jgi:carboxyvinyl-carboxyphosphonate phosphorylmutase